MSKKKGKTLIEVFENEWGRSEDAFAVALGLKREALSALRKSHLEEGLDWGLLKGRITYFCRGELKMKGIVALRVGLEVDEVELDEEIVDQTESLTVLQVFPINRRLVECERAEGEVVKVTVGDNANFLKGMVLTARPPWGSGRLWVMVGSKPRWRGKW